MDTLTGRCLARKFLALFWKIIWKKTYLFWKKSKITKFTFFFTYVQKKVGAIFIWGLPFRGYGDEDMHGVSRRSFRISMEFLPKF